MLMARSMRCSCGDSWRLLVASCSLEISWQQVAGNGQLLSHNKHHTNLVIGVRSRLFDFCHLLQPPQLICKAGRAPDRRMENHTPGFIRMAWACAGEFFSLPHLGPPAAAIISKEIASFTLQIALFLVVADSASSQSVPLR